MILKPLRALTRQEILALGEDGIECPACGQPPQTGTIFYDDGPGFTWAIRSFFCPTGHFWRTEFDDS